MKSKRKEEAVPLLVKNLIKLHEYPQVYSEGHWDILLGTLKMVFNQFPEIDDYLNAHVMSKKDQKFFNHKLKDLMPIARGEI